MIEVEKIGEVTKFRMARTLLGRGVYFTAAYWVDGLVIDTGCLYTVDEFVDALDGLPVHRIVNTHSHEDHVAANAALHAKYRAEILAHAAALPILADPLKNRLHPYQHVLWGRPEPSSGAAVGESLETEHHRFKVIWTPGHSLDHVCLYEPETGWLFSGDTYVGGKDRALRADYNIWQILESLKSLAALDSSMLFPGSGTVRPNPKEDLLKKIAYLEETGRRALDLHQKGWNRRRIRKKLFGPEMVISYYTLGHFSGKNLVRSYIENYPSATVIMSQ
jgi:glyoxylase-like metal-dependent hydrolase (beta-lactamase superfamily II)